MAEREQVRKSAPSERESEAEVAPTTSERGEEIKAELDDLLDIRGFERVRKALVSNNRESHHT